LSGFLPFWPEQASAYAASVDRLVLAFSALIIVLSAPVFLAIIAFAIKYRRGKPADRSHPMNRNVWVETSWAVIPFLLILIFYVWSTQLYFGLHRPPADALEIEVVAKQWMWKFQHAGGQGEINELHVPTGTNIKLNMISQDVIHSLYLPVLRIKQDVLPGRYTTLWFNADKPGTYRMTCAEFCGTDHSVMGGSIVVQEPDDFSLWLETSATDSTLAAQGAALFRRFGCSGCHEPHSSVRAPSLAGIYGQPVALNNGTAVIADAQYIRDSILLPNAQVAAGYAPIMPTFANVATESDLIALTAYIQSLATDNSRSAPIPTNIAPEGTAP
jgi:cytochrome c oxidase subunit 2